MNKEQWENYKKNNINNLWKVPNITWCYELFDWKTINFLKKFKKGRTLFKAYQKLRFKVTKKPAITMLEYVVTTRCTLNCKECNSIMPKFTNETHSKITTFEEFKADIDKFLKSVDYVSIFVFCGGETLLASELDKMVEYACSKKKLHHILIATNCTILPNEKLLKAMQNKRLSVQISDYSHVKNIKNDVTVKYHEFKQLLIDNKIRFNNYQEKRGSVTWYSAPEIYKDKQDEKCLTERYQTSCIGEYLIMMCDGVITNCLVGPYISRNLELTPELKEELIDIRSDISEKDLTKKLINLYNIPHSQLCHYCHFENIKTNLPCGEQVE